MKKIKILLLSILTGILLTLGWPLNGYPFILLIAFVPLLFVEDYLEKNRNDFSKFSISFFVFPAFFTWNLLTTWWIWNSTEFGAIMAILLNSLFMTIVFTVFHISKRNFLNRSHAAYLLIFYWIAFEFLHLNWDLSWSWLNLGNGFAAYTKWVQWYEYTGTFGGTFWILLVNILIFKCLNILLNKQIPVKRIIITGIISFVFIITPLIISLSIYNNYTEESNPVGVIVTQPNIDPWTEQFTLPQQVVIDKNLNMAREVIDKNTEFIVCPESAIQENIWHRKIQFSPSILQIQKFIKEYPDVNIVIGASTFRVFADDEPITRTARKFSDADKYYDAYNTALFINSKEDIGFYHKSKLVPGPEKMPFQKLLRPLQNIVFDLGGTVGSLGFSKERTVFTSSDGKYKVPAIICYESIYGEFCAEFVRNGANLLFIITNDGWWGNSPGYKQHFSFAPLRAVETRRSLARSANTGISCFVNQRGDIFEKTKYWVPAVIKADLNASNRITFYVKYGDYTGRVSTFLSALFLLITITTAIINKKKPAVKFKAFSKS